MPIYEYQCNKCNHVFEIFHKVDEEVTAACPSCLGSARKIISASNFVLKGSGFYVNDYPSSNRNAGKKAEREATEKPAPPKTEEKRVEKKAD
jgi:putative FmdB family regulatory protein